MEIVSLLDNKSDNLSVTYMMYVCDLIAQVHSYLLLLQYFLLLFWLIVLCTFFSSSAGIKMTSDSDINMTKILLLRENCMANC